MAVEGTREDAERALHEMQVPVNTWLDYWLKEYVEPDRRSRTVEDYRRQVRLHIGPAMGSHYLHDVRPHHIREFLNRKDKQLSRSSVGKLHQILSGAFKEAWRNNLITDNPVAKTPRLVAQGAAPRPRVEHGPGAADPRLRPRPRATAGTSSTGSLPSPACASARPSPWSGSTSTPWGSGCWCARPRQWRGAASLWARPRARRGGRDIPINDALVAALLRPPGGP